VYVLYWHKSTNTDADLASMAMGLLHQNARAKSICVAEAGGGGAAEARSSAAAGIDDSAVAGAAAVAVSRGAGHVAYTFGGVSSRACVLLPGKGEEGGQLQPLQVLRLLGLLVQTCKY